MKAALPFMDGDMRDFAARTLSKVETMTEAEPGLPETYHPQTDRRAHEENAEECDAIGAK
jgi:hypothetical protein